MSERTLLLVGAIGVAIYFVAGRSDTSSSKSNNPAGGAMSPQAGNPDLATSILSAVSAIFNGMGSIAQATQSTT